MQSPSHYSILYLTEAKRTHTFCNWLSSSLPVDIRPKDAQVLHLEISKEKREKRVTFHRIFTNRQGGVNSVPHFELQFQMKPHVGVKPATLRYCLRVSRSTDWTSEAWIKLAVVNIRSELEVCSSLYMIPVAEKFSHHKRHPSKS